MSFLPSTKPCKATLTATDPDGQVLSWSWDVDPRDACKGLLIHRIAGKKLIQELEEGELARVLSPDEIRSKVIDIATQ